MCVCAFLLVLWKSSENYVVEVQDVFGLVRL